MTVHPYGGWNPSMNGETGKEVDSEPGAEVMSEWEELPRSSVNDSLEDRWWLMGVSQCALQGTAEKECHSGMEAAWEWAGNLPPCHISHERRTDLLESSLCRKTELTTAWWEESSVRMTRWRNCPEVRWWRTFLKTCQFHREEAGLELKEGRSITMY